MAILNFGSINIDRFVRVPYFPAPGETLSARSAAQGLGGKGLNQSIAIARAGGRVRHLGAIGAGDGWILQALAEEGLDTAHIAALPGIETVQAVVMVDDAGENSIILLPGANHQHTPARAEAAIATMAPGDWLLGQCETNLLAEVVAMARAAGLQVALAAAPFDAEAVIPLLPSLDLLAVNAVEYAQLCAAVGGAEALPPALRLLITHGEDGAELRDGGQSLRVPAFSVEAVDTTGAGDVFLGYFLAGIDGGGAPKAALIRAAAAAALQVTRPGAVDAIPRADEVAAFIAAKNRA